LLPYGMRSSPLLCAIIFGVKCGEGSLVICVQIQNDGITHLYMHKQPFSEGVLPNCY
jgi:hypothetical protein